MSLGVTPNVTKEFAVEIDRQWQKAGRPRK